LVPKLSINFQRLESSIIFSIAQRHSKNVNDGE